MTRKGLAVGAEARATLPIATPAGVTVGEVSWELPAALVTVGDVRIPDRVEAVFFGGEHQPQLTLTLEIRNGVPGFTRVEVLSNPDGPLVITKHLKLTGDRLALWRNMIVEAVAQQPTDSEDSALSTPSWADPSVARESVKRARKPSRQISLEKLQMVAAIYTANVAGNPVQAVADHYGSYHRTAARWVQICRSPEYGLLPPTTRGKRKA